MFYLFNLLNNYLDKSLHDKKALYFYIGKFMMKNNLPQVLYNRTHEYISHDENSSLELLILLHLRIIRLKISLCLKELDNL